MELTVKTKLLQQALKSIDTVFTRSALKPAEGITILMTVDAKKKQLKLEAANQGLYTKALLPLDNVGAAGTLLINGSYLQGLKLSAKTTELKLSGNRLRFKSRVRGEIEVLQDDTVTSQIPVEIDFDFKIETAALVRGIKSIGFSPTVMEKNLAVRLVQEGDDFILTMNDSVRAAQFGTEVDITNDDDLEVVIPLGFIAGMASRVDKVSVDIGCDNSTIRISTDYFDVYHPLRQDTLPDLKTVIKDMLKGKADAVLEFDSKEAAEAIGRASSIVSGVLGFYTKVLLTMDSAKSEVTVHVKSSIGEANEKFPATSTVNSSNQVVLSSKFTQEFLGLIKGKVAMHVFGDRILLKAEDSDLHYIMATVI